MPTVADRPLSVKLRPWLEEELREEFEGGSEIWEIVAARREYGSDPAALREHFGWLPEQALQEALSYYERFPERIDALLEANERAGRYLAGRLGRS
ncbi:MAG: hypothetical protein Q8W49_11820 [Candidatus Palauibacterales bacterium]|nr:hypothetical protein [Candidatus Palauibacterales bacterium]MDP2583521.1 hypothetical protein [Candidatus Palauibacterales bacterium]